MTGRTPTDDLIRRAEAGEARAQYELAAALAAAGRREEAEPWLKRAAAGGDPEAHYTLGTRLLQTKAGLAQARALLEKSVGGGSTGAMRALAVLKADGFGEPSDWPAATALVLKAARAGDAAAARGLAGLLLFGDEHDADGAALLSQAAARDAVAGAAFVRRAAEGRANAAAAEDVLGRLAGVGYPRAAILRERLKAQRTDSRPIAGGASPQPDFARIETRLAGVGELIARARGADAQTLSNAPYAYLVRKAISPELLEYTMAASARLLSPSMTFDPATGVPRRDEYRTSMTATLGPADQDLTLVAINQLLAGLARIDPARGEFLSVLRYAPGEEYRPHFDWIPPTGRDFGASGQRMRTALLYLNDEYEGGETHFIASDLKVKGAPGDVLVFSNVCGDGTPDSSSRHSGLPVRAGVKWLGSKWFRERVFDF